CLHEFGTDLKTAENMTLRECSLRVKSFKVKGIEKERELHYQSWLNRQVEATNEVGRNREDVYKKSADCYEDKKKREETETQNLDKEKARVANIGHMANERRERMSRYSVEAILSVKGAERFRAAFDNASQAVERMEQASSTVRGVSQKIGSIGSDLTNKITKPALVATGALAGMVGALGFKRLVGMDNAQAKLKGLGVEGKQLEQVMQDVDSAVTGTTHTMAEGADVAAGALAAGVKEGADLERYIKLVGDAATGANVPMGEMAQIFNRVQGTGKMTRDELNQIEHRLPGFSQA